MDHNDLKFYLNWLKDQLRQPVSINPFRLSGISHLSIGPVHFHFKGCWVLFFVFFFKF